MKTRQSVLGMFVVLLATSLALAKDHYVFTSFDPPVETSAKQMIAVRLFLLENVALSKSPLHRHRAATAVGSCRSLTMRPTARKRCNSTGSAPP